jgi:hypothetical protein
MKVHFVTIRLGEDDSIDSLLDRFEDGIPKCLPLEGGDGIQYVFCLKYSPEEIMRICDEVDCEVLGLWERSEMFISRVLKEVAIDDAAYNSEYAVTISYDPMRPYYGLEYKG